MTPPAKPAASAGASADVKIEPPPPAVPKPADKKAEDKKAQDQDPPRLEWKFSLGFGAETQGDRNGGLFGINNISAFGDYTHFLLNGGLAHDLNRGKVRFRLGGQVQFDGSKGNENTSGSTLWSLGLGPRAELDWKRAYGDGLGGVFVGPGSVGLYALLGYGWGTTNVDGGFKLYDQSGLATAVGADLNVFGFNVGNVHVGADFYAQTTSIYGSDFNNAGWSLGGLLTIRPSTKKMREVVREPYETCESEADFVAKQEALLKKLREENATTAASLGELKYYLEAHPKHPYNQANMRKSLVIGAIAEQMQAKKVEPAKIAEAVKAADKAEAGKIAETMAAKSGVAVDDVKKMQEVAEGRYPSDYDFWKLPEDPNFEIKSDRPANPKEEQCKDLRKYRDDLVEAVGKLRERKGHIEALYKAAVHLAGLTLGDTEVKEVLSATVINIDTPSFKSARPNAKDMAELKGGGDLAKKAKEVFSVPEFEMKKLDELADWLNGKGDLPGEERIRQILKDEGLNKGGLEDTPEAKQALREFHKKLSLGIFGHTDSDGDDKMNQELSERRAEFIKQYLVSKGVSADRLVAKGFGEKYPAMPETKGNATDRIIAKGKNRRVEFVPVGVTGPITPSADANPDHVDSKQVPKDEGGTGKKDAPKKTEPKKDAPAPKKDAPPPPPPPKKDEPKKTPDF